jgi:polyhydroxyalkanoate synthesis regulator protein
MVFCIFISNYLEANIEAFNEIRSKMKTEMNSP